MVWKNMLEKSMAPHLPFYGYTAFGSQYSNPASFLASLIVNSSVCQPLLNIYKDAVMYRFKSYGLRYDDKNIHTPIFFRAINKFSSKEQQQYLRRVNRGFDCLTKKEKVPQNVWEEEMPHHRWMAKAVEEATYEEQEFEQYEELAHKDMKQHRL